METKKVWFVTGASKGIGLSLVKKLLANNYRVAATSRNVKDLIKEIGENADFLPLEVNIVNENSVKSAINKTLEIFKEIDVIINNAGYGQLGTLEELTDAESRANFDANVFGTLNIIRNVMPHLRSKNKGHIFNISSIGGFTGEFAGWGVYCATKFAVAGFTEALSAEVKEFNIHATVVYPGYFRTNFLEKGSLKGPVNPLNEYTEARKLETIHEDSIKGNQPGDPEKVAAVLIQVYEMKNPPLHLFLGTDSFHIALNKLKTLEIALNENETISKSTNF